MSSSGILNTAESVLSTGVIIAIVVGSVIGLAILVCIIIVICCVCCKCCKKKKTYPGAVLQQPQQYPGSANQPPYATNTYYN